MKQTELITNNDGSIFHLHLFPEDIEDTIILVGDPGRVKLIGTLLDSIRVEKNNREFYSISGTFNNKGISVISTGIGTDNIDIVVNELDALANIDLNTGEIKEEKRKLNFIRIGTSGSLQTDIDAGAFLLSTHSVGFDGLLNFYQGVETITNLDFEKAFIEHTNWSSRLPVPYVVSASNDLVNCFGIDDVVKGINISAPGFYGPQGRHLRISPLDPNINKKLSAFSYNGMRITNYEMESSAIYGLSKLLGHNALTICVIIGNRTSGKFINDYNPYIQKLSLLVLKSILK